MAGQFVEGPVEIAPEALAEPEFNHKNVRMRIVNARAYIDEDGATSFPIDFVINPDQPEHPELEEFAGFRVTNWLRTDPKSVRDYKEFCATFDIDPQRPDMSKLKGSEVIAALKTNPGKGDNAGKVYHNVNRVQPA